MKRLLVLSGKGGTGKTTVSAAFIDFLQARAFADCDVDAPNLHLVAGLKEEPERKAYFGSQKAVIDPAKCIACGNCFAHCRFGAIHRGEDGHCQVNQYACEGCGVCTYVCPVDAAALQEDVAGEQQLYLGERVFSTARLKMGRGNSGKLVSAVKLDLLKNAPAEAEIAVLDGSPGIGCPVIASVSGMDLVLIVTEPSRSGLHDLERLVKTAGKLEARTAVCVNRFDTAPEQAEAIERFCQEEGIPFLGRIPYDRAASQAINQGHSLAAVDCPARDALYQVFQKTMHLLELQNPSVKTEE